jgi:hypothetical protein
VSSPALLAPCLKSSRCRRSCYQILKLIVIFNVKNDMHIWILTSTPPVCHDGIMLRQRNVLVLYTVVPPTNLVFLKEINYFLPRTVILCNTFIFRVAATHQKFQTAAVLHQIIVSVQIITHVLQSLFTTLTLTLFM